MWKDDPEGDFGRQKRQKILLNAVINKASTAEVLLDFESISTIIGSNLKTNIQFDAAIDLKNNYSADFLNAEQFTFSEGQGKLIDGIYYYELNANELASTQKQIKKILGNTTDKSSFINEDTPK